MQIKRVINNNIVSAMDGATEVVISGCGIGFGHREGDEIDPARIEKIFRMEDSDKLKRFKDLLANVPAEHLDIADRIITLAKGELSAELNENIYVTLTDHISFALQRLEMGMTFENALTHEVQLFYPEEYRIGEKALELIRERTGKELVADEAASIALHLVSAELSERISFAYEITQSVKAILQILADAMGLSDGEKDPLLDDMIPSIKQMVYRVINDQQYDERDDKLYEFATASYPVETKVCKQVTDYLEERFGRKIKKDECSYIIISLHKLNLPDNPVNSHQ